MSFDAFLTFDTSAGINGETIDKEFAPKNAIQIFSFSLGASNPTTVGLGKGMAAGKVSISSFNFMKKTDAASPILFQSCCSGASIKTAEVILRKSGGTTPLKFLRYSFKDVMVESVQWSGSEGGDDTPTESVSLAYADVTIGYFKQDSATGQADGGEITGSWNLQTNAKDA